jgi:hypothetical protein
MACALPPIDDEVGTGTAFDPTTISTTTTTITSETDTAQIVYTGFPIPKGPQRPKTLDTAPEAATADESSTQTSTQSTNKENAEPVPPVTAEGVLPLQLQQVYTSITSTLTSLFTKYPPHTIQRLAELILSPKEHYRTLASYLHALDRVVHVTSGAHTFPLPPAIPDLSSLSVLSNGTTGVDPLSISWVNPSSVSTASALGSDESLGGALLTPITWLSKPSTGIHSPLEGEVKTESTTMTDGPNGPGGVETVSVSVNGVSSATASPPKSDTDLTATLRAEGGVTQGELLRQEQRAGVVPAAQLQNRGDVDGMGEEDELPHARGPEEIGMEDMGPQGESSSSERKGGVGQNIQGIDIERAVGRKIDGSSTVEGADDEIKDEVEMDVVDKTPSTPKREAEDDIGGSEKKRAKSEEVKSDGKDTEMPLVDTAGAKGEDEAEEDETKKDSDAVDTTSL